MATGRQTRFGTVRRVLDRTQLLVTLLGFLAVWEFGVRVSGVPGYILPPPSVILGVLIERAPTLAYHAAVTTTVILVGFTLAVLVGIPLALGVAFSPWFKRVVYPAIVLSQMIPKIAVAPLFIIWFGFDVTPRILITFLIAFFPIVIDAVVGFTSLQPEAVRLARSMGARPLDFFLKVRLPHALPNLFAGMKMAMAGAAVGAIVGEFVASSAGLGYLLLVANGELNTPLVFAGIFVLSSIGIALYFTIELAERAMIPWHASRRTRAAP